MPQLHPTPASPAARAQGQGHQGCRADGEALADGRGGVARRVQGIGAATHLRVEQRHLRDAAWAKLGQAGAHGAEVSRWSGPGLN